MSGINKVILVGHVGKDPEVKYLEGGVAVAKFPLATSEVYKNKEGQRVEVTLINEIDNVENARDIDAERALLVFSLINFKRLSPDSATPS